MIKRNPINWIRNVNRNQTMLKKKKEDHFIWTSASITQAETTTRFSEYYFRTRFDLWHLRCMHEHFIDMDFYKLWLWDANEIFDADVASLKYTKKSVNYFQRFRTSKTTFQPQQICLFRFIYMLINNFVFSVLFVSNIRPKFDSNNVRIPSCITIKLPISCAFKLKKKRSKLCFVCSCVFDMHFLFLQMCWSDDI